MKLRVIFFTRFFTKIYPNKQKKNYDSHFGEYIWRDLKIGLCLYKDVTSISTFW